MNSAVIQSRSPLNSYNKYVFTSNYVNMTTFSHAYHVYSTIHFRLTLFCINPHPLANHLALGLHFSCKSSYSWLSLFLQITLLMSFAFLANHLTHGFRFSCKSPYSCLSLFLQIILLLASISLANHLTLGHLSAIPLPTVHFPYHSI